MEERYEAACWIKRVLYAGQTKARRMCVARKILVAFYSANR